MKEYPERSENTLALHPLLEAYRIGVMSAAMQSCRCFESTDSLNRFDFATLRRKRVRARQDRIASPRDDWRVQARTLCTACAPLRPGLGRVDQGGEDARVTARGEPRGRAPVTAIRRVIVR